jgi:vitamin B12 transporter
LIFLKKLIKNRNMKKVVLFIATAFITQWGFSQEKINLDTVTIASRTKENIKAIGKVVYKMDSIDLVKFAGQSVAQALNTVPGVEINNAQGNFGSILGYYVRGGRSKDVLIMIDGIPVGDPSHEVSYYDLNLLSLDQVQSIEIIKGGNSALYGSNASAGVINITLKKNSKKKIAANLGINVGSYGTTQQNIQVGGKLNKFNYNIVGTNFKTDGISSAYGEGFENDEGEKQNLMTQIGFTPNESIDMKLFFQFNNQRYNFDNDSFLDDSNYVASTKEVAYGFQTEIKQANKGQLSINAKGSEFDRNTGFGITQSKNYFLGITENYEFNKNLKLLAGIELNNQNQAILNLNGQLVRSASDSKFTTINPYMGAVFTLGDFKLIGNGRLNTHSDYDNHFVYAITPSYLLKINEDYSVSAKGSVSTAYITPTLYQLFGGDAFTGEASTTINPQESITYEGGLSFYFKDKLTFNSTFFYREDKNPILSRYVGPKSEYYGAKGQFNTKGLELDMKYTPNKKITFGSSYTYTYLDRDLDQRRIPKNKLVSYLTLKDVLLENYSISIIHSYISNRMDSFFDYNSFTDQKVELNPYNLLSISMTQSINKDLKFNFMVNNILNHHYFEIVGYTARGVNYWLGANYSF